MPLPRDYIKGDNYLDTHRSALGFLLLSLLKTSYKA